MATAPGKLENKGGDKPKYNPRSQTPKGQRRTQNPCILSDGSVDPKCKTYQRSVAGREKLEDYVKRLDSQGVEEKDIFMAAVKSLTNRGHGYVGAYLDSKNPNRRYEENQAQAIADSVMTKAGVGSHPGARLTKEEEGTKEARAEKRASVGPSEPGKKAMSVRQQRKQPGGRGKEAMGMPETWAKSGRGVDENAVRQRREDGQPEVEPGEIKSDVDVDKDRGTSLSKPEVKAPPIPKPTPKGPTGVDPTSPVQRRIKELSKPPEPTSEQQEEIDKIMAAKDDMDPEEWAKSLEEMFALVKAGPGRQRQELRDYMDRLKGKGKREAAPLPGTAAGVKREEDVARGLEEKKSKQEKLQAAAQAGKERAAEERKLAQEREEDKRIEEEMPIEEVGAPGQGSASPVDIVAAIKEQYNSTAKKEGLGKATNSYVKGQWNKNSDLFLKNLDAAIYDLEAPEEEGGKNLKVDRSSLRELIRNSFFFDPGPIEGESEQEPGPSEQQPQAQPSQPGGGKVSYIKPNFQREWDEAIRYPEFESAGIEEWIKAASKGSTQKYSVIQDSLGNVDLDYDSLEEQKKQRFEQAFQSGKVEAPIAVRFEDGTYDLVAGNTRLSGLVKNGQDPTVWVVDVKDLEGAGGEEQEAPASTRETLPEERLRRKGKPTPSGKGFGAQKKIAESAIRKKGERVLADVQKANELQRRMENSPVAKEEEMGDFIRDKLPGILAKFTSQEKKRKSSGNKDRMKELMDQEGMSSSQALAQIRKETGVKPKSKAPKKKKTSDNSEYGKFAEAVKQVVRIRSAQRIH